MTHDFACKTEGCSGRTNFSHRLCLSCWEKRQIEWWEKLPVVSWNGEGMVCSDRDGDKFYTSIEEAAESMEDDEDLDDLRLVICEPQRARYFSVDEWVCDEAHDDWDGGAEAGEVERKINDLLQSLGVLSYFPGKTRPDTTHEQKHLDLVRGPHPFDRRFHDAESLKTAPFLAAYPPWCGTCGERVEDPRHGAPAPEVTHGS